jgi:uncharacterized protein YjbI with pentapeptide repeats
MVWAQRLHLIAKRGVTAMNIRILSITLLFGFGVQTGFGFDQATLDFVKKNKRLPKMSEVGKQGDALSTDLSGAPLSHADLTGANLTSATLTGANLTSATLTRATLTGANLTSATLTFASLYYANLSNAKLTNANLTYASLYDANLSNANLSGATQKNIPVTKAWLKEKGALNVDTVKDIN